MSTAAKTIAALVFVALLGVVLTVPLRDSDPSSPPQRVATAPSEEPSPSPTKGAPGTSGPLRTERFVQRYPKDCLRPVPRPDGAGLVAVHEGRRVIVADTNGTRTAIIQPVPRIGPPIAWSPSGRYLAVGPQGLFWTAQGEHVIHMNGEFQHGMVQGRSGKWSWSPISDCGVEIEDHGGALLVANIDSRSTLFGLELLRRGVESFAYSHDGRKLGLVLREGRIRSLWMAHLAQNRLQEVRRFPRSTCCIELAGWSPDDRDLLYWAGSGAWVMADGWPLEGVNVWGKVFRYTPRTSSGGFRLRNGIFTEPDWLVDCDGRLLAPLGGDRFLASRRVISFLRRNRRPIRVSSGNFADVDPTCSPNGELIVVARSGASKNTSSVLSKGALYLLSATDPRNADVLRPITKEGGASEAYPEWGPSGTGIIYVVGETRPDFFYRLWFLSEGSSAGRSLGLLASCEFADRTDDVTPCDPTLLFDWSATPPDGLPAG